MTGRFLSLGGGGGRETQGDTGGGGWAHGVQGKGRRILIVTMKFTDPP